MSGVTISALIKKMNLELLTKEKDLSFDGRDNSLVKC